MKHNILTTKITLACYSIVFIILRASAYQSLASKQASHPLTYNSWQTIPDWCPEDDAIHQWCLLTNCCLWNHPNIVNHNSNVAPTNLRYGCRWFVDHAMTSDRFDQICRHFSSDSASIILLAVSTTVVAFFESFFSFLVTPYCVIYTGIFLIPIHFQIFTSNLTSFWNILLVMGRLSDFH